MLVVILSFIWSLSRPTLAHQLMNYMFQGGENSFLLSEYFGQAINIIGKLH